MITITWRRRLGQALLTPPSWLLGAYLVNGRLSDFAWGGAIAAALIFGYEALASWFKEKFE